MRSVLAIVAVVVLVAGSTARAADCTMPDGGWPDAGLALPDGGVLDVPVQLACGQPAPFAGWELSEKRVEKLTTAPPATVVLLEPDAGAAPSSSPTLGECVGGVVAVGLVIFGAGFLVGHEVK
jgi:hypothetical protein